MASSNMHRQAFAKLLEYARRGESFKPGASSGGGTSDEWSGVTFRLGEARLACNITRVQEILPPPPATSVPGSKPWILGLANVRGTLMTVVDLPWFLTGKRTALTARSRVLATSLQKAPLGLLIDEVFGQRHFLSSDASDAVLPEDSPLRGVVQRKHLVGSETWHELDLDQLFKSPEFTNGAAA
jgi:twitching motility protein PilI